MMRKTNLQKSWAIGELGWWNAWWAFWGSWVIPVLAGNKAGVPVERWFRGPRNPVEVEYNDKLKVEETAWRFYRRCFNPASKSPLFYQSAGLRLDYAPLLLKSVADELIRYVGLRFSARRLGWARPSYFGRLLWPGLRGRMEKGGAVVRFIHRFTLWLDEMQMAFGRLGLQMARIAIALLTPRRPAQGINTVWLGVGPEDYRKYGEKRSFYWPDRVKSALKVLYILSYPPKRAFQKVLAEEAVCWASQFHILQFCGKGRLLDLAFRLLRAAAALFLPWRGSWILRARLCGMHFESLAWDAFARDVRVRAAFTVASSWTSTRPVLVALKNAGAKTGLWHYSANVIPVHHRGGKPYCNGRWRTVHEADRIYVWNRHGAEWHRRNLCDHPRNEIVISGPVMCGDAGLCLRSREPADKRLRIAVFDIPTPAGKKRRQIGNPHIPDEYFTVFWQDVRRLLDDLPESVLVLKPKRSLEDLNRSFAEVFLELVRDKSLIDSGRVQLIDDDADPYEAIAACDVALGMPFTSPVAAAWHFGRVGIYYDPTRIIAADHFLALEKYFCSDYAALLLLLREAGDAKRNGVNIAGPDEIGRFTGRNAGDNPQEVFLGDVSEWILGASRQGTKRAPRQSVLA
jgi:hypothetical protein